MSKLDVYWCWNKAAWVDGKISLEWLDKSFWHETRDFCKKKNLAHKVLLTMDNAPGHTAVLEGRHPEIEVIFLPKNTTSVIQPLDQEVIASFKKKYYTRTYRQLREDTGTTLAQVLRREGGAQNLDIIEEEKLTEKTIKEWWKSYNIKNAVDNCVAVWRDVSQEQIVRAWRPILGLPKDTGHEGETREGEDMLFELHRVGRVFAQVTEEAMREVVEGGNAEFSINDIISGMEKEDEAEEEEQQVEEKVPEAGMKSVANVIEIGENLKSAMLELHLGHGASNAIEIDRILQQYRDEYAVIINKMKQARTTSFFRPRPVSRIAGPSSYVSGRKRPTMVVSDLDSDPDSIPDHTSEVSPIEGPSGVSGRKRPAMVASDSDSNPDSIPDHTSEVSPGMKSSSPN